MNCQLDKLSIRWIVRRPFISSHAACCCCYLFDSRPIVCPCLSNSIWRSASLSRNIPMGSRATMLLCRSPPPSPLLRYGAVKRQFTGVKKHRLSSWRCRRWAALSFGGISGSSISAAGASMPNSANRRASNVWRPRAGFARSMAKSLKIRGKLKKRRYKKIK